MKGSLVVLVMAAAVGLTTLLAFVLQVFVMPPVLPTSQASSNPYDATFSVSSESYPLGAPVSFRLENQGEFPLTLECGPKVQRLVGRVWETVAGGNCPEEQPVLGLGEVREFFWDGTSASTPIEPGQYRALVEIRQGSGVWILIVGFRLEAAGPP
jgi:hypothetical protein